MNILTCTTKGYWASCLIHFTGPVVQFRLESLFMALYPSIDLSLPAYQIEHYLPQFGVVVGISALKGLLMSPLETVRTRYDKHK